MKSTFEFPDIIHINVVDAETRLAVQDMTLVVHLLALRNMDHYILTPFSDNQGNINISKEWLIDQMDTSLPADYGSSLDDLYPRIEVMTATEDDINKSIELLSNNQRHVENMARIEDLLNSINGLYSQTRISVELNNEPEIWLTLEIVKLSINPKEGISSSSN
jgi:hypothetical protein